MIFFFMSFYWLGSQSKETKVKSLRNTMQGLFHSRLLVCKVRIRHCRPCRVRACPSVSNGAIELQSKHWLVPCEATRQQSFWPEKHFKWQTLNWTEVGGQPIQPFRLIENGHLRVQWLKICLQKRAGESMALFCGHQDRRGFTIENQSRFGQY